MRNYYLLAVAAAVITAGQIPAYATLVDVTSPGNLLALLPASDLAASSVASFGGVGPPEAVDNKVNTSSQDDGQIFADTDPDQRLVITGFNSSIGEIRFFGDPTDLGRAPSSLTIYFSRLSTTSLLSGSVNYTGLNGGILLPATPLTAASFTAHRVSGANSGYIDLFVNAPIGTQTLLFDVGSANGLGDRIGEVQAFAQTPEPGSGPMLALSAVFAAVFHAAKRRRAKA